MLLVDALSIIALSCGAAILSEVLCISVVLTSNLAVVSWLLIYRTDSYKSQAARIESMQQKLEKLKRKGKGAQDKQNAKKIGNLETSLKDASQELQMTKMKSMVFTGFALISLLGLLHGQFGGHVVAILPFEPISLVRFISHRGLDGENFYECAHYFLYALTSICMKQNLQRYTGFAPPTIDQSMFSGAQK